MKKFLLSLAAVAALGMTAQADDLTWNSAQADFNTFNGGKALTTYATYSSAGGWEVKNTAILDAGTYSFMTGTNVILAPTLNGAKYNTLGYGSLTSPTLQNGLGTLKFNYGFAYNDTAIDFQVNIKQNGEIVKTDTQKLSGLTKETAYEYTLNVDITGEFVIEILNIVGSTSTSNTKRMSIWNLEWTNCGVAKEDPNLSFSEEFVNIEGATVEALNEAFTAPSLTKDTDGNVTYSSSNEKVATVNETTGEVTIVNYGSAIITATSEGTETYSAGTAAYTIVVSPGTISVAKALELLGEGLEFNATVEGYITRITSTSVGNYGGLTYYISDDLEASNELQVYYGLGLNGEPFTSVDDIKVGAWVLVNGDLFMYQSKTPEINQNSEQIAYYPDGKPMPNMYLLSNISGWEANDENQMTYNAEEDTYTWTGDVLSVSFKINNGAWDAGYNIGAEGEGEYIGIGTPFQAVNAETSKDILIAENYVVEDAKVVLDIKTLEITLTGNLVYKKPEAPEEITLMGSFDDWKEGVVLEKDQAGLYQGSITLEASENPIEFKLSSSAGWYGAVDGEANVTLNEEEETVLNFSITGSNWTIENWEGGTITATVDWNDFTLTLSYKAADDDNNGDGDGEGDGPTVGINGISAENGAVEYFNLQGVRVANPVKGGVYILRQGDKTAKVVVR